MNKFLLHSFEHQAVITNDRLKDYNIIIAKPCAVSLVLANPVTNKHRFFFCFGFQCLYIQLYKKCTSNDFSWGLLDENNVTILTGNVMYMYTTHKENLEIYRVNNMTYCDIDNNFVLSKLLR